VGEGYFRLEVQHEASSRKSNRLRYSIYRKTHRTTVTGTVDLRMGFIGVVEGIGVWIFRQKSCGVNVHASIFPESRQRCLRTSG